MDVATGKDCSLLLSSPLPSPNVPALLKIKILSWSQETGLPVSVSIRIADRTFNLHKHPLTCKSGFFKEKLKESNEVELPQNFPGGPETLEMIALFIYGSSTLVDPFNVAALRCAAEFLRMTEEYGSGNLCERFDIYLNQVVLQNWDDTLIVLQKCLALLPWAEELLIVSRCIETLAFMACMEILDPERRRDHPVVTLEDLAFRPWTDATVKDIINQDLWIKDLIALPFSFFKRIIESLRRQGMKEKYVSPILLFYAKKWVLSTKTQEFWDGKEIKDDDKANDVAVVLQGIIDLLPVEEKASKVIPVEIYFSLLSRSLELGVTNGHMEKLQSHIASLLHLAEVDYLLVPKDGSIHISSSQELAVMETIFSKCVSNNVDPEHTPSNNKYIVAELWDIYLNQIAKDPRLGCQRFMDLVEIVPIKCRRTHDHLYRVLDTFLQCHRTISQEEKGQICKFLDCQKLSQQVCVEAVQNELMPLRLIVQALFVQQLNTQQAFKECSDSFRYAHCGEFSGSLPSSTYAYSKSKTLGESPYMNISEGGFLPQQDLAVHSSEIPRKYYESTSFRIQNLEREIMSLKRSLQSRQILNKAEPSSKKTVAVSNSQQSIGSHGFKDRRMSNQVGQVTSCIGTVNFASQRKYANRLLKMLKRMSLFGRGRSRRKPGAPVKRQSQR